MSPNNLLIVGISGVTCSGKTTAATKLNKILPESKMISQDDYFLDVDDERHVWIPELNHINYDILSSLDMEKMHEDILRYIKGYKRLNNNPVVQNDVFDKLNEEDLEKCLPTILQQTQIRILIIEGFCIFNYKPMRDIFDLKYYFTLEKDECYRRRLTREYDPPDCPGYFEKCVWPEHLNQLKEVQQDGNDLLFFSQKTENPVHQILQDIVRVLKSFD